MKNYFLFILGILLSQSLVAQEKKSLELGETRELISNELGETRSLNIYLPPSYSADSSKHYPVIYLLDGSIHEDFMHVVGVVQFLTMIEAMPESIVVGIANVDRRRDFTFPTTIEQDLKDYPTTGSSAKFVAFLDKELKPFVSKNYRITEETSIIGQSLGGLLATEILFKHPGLFQNYLIVSPSLWWDNESLFGELNGIYSKVFAGNQHVLISVGQEGKVMVDDAQKLSKLLKKYTPFSKNISYRYFPEENHLTILHNAIYQSLVELYKK